MSLRVNQNVLAVQTHGILSGTSDRLAKSIEKLSSGLRINRAADDAAGLTISEKLRRQIKGLARAVMNAQDGISMIQTGESALSETHSILQRMRELSVQASNDTLTSNDRFEIQKEIVQLRDDINRISRNTEFNTKKLLDGSQAAIVSTSSSSGKAIVTGAPNIQGDFNIQIAQIDPGTAQEQRSNIFTLKGTSTYADSSTKLEDIAQFYDANDVFALASSQTLTIQADSNMASIQVSKDLTLRQLAERIQTAITDDLGISGTLAYINTSTSSVPGSMQIVSGQTGGTGEIAFSADQALFSALGFTETTESVDAISQVTRSNADGTNPITTQINSNRASGLIDGIDIQFESAAQARATGTVQASAGVIVTAAVSIRLTDYAGTAVTASFTAAGSYSLDQIASIINSATVTGSSRIRASVVAGRVQLKTIDLGSAAYVKIAAASGSTSAVTDLHIGLAEGTFVGTGGTVGEVAGSAVIQNLSFAGGNDVTIGITDEHGVSASISLALTYNSVDNLVSVINNAIEATPDGVDSAVVTVRAFNSNGIIGFRSTESGQRSNFTISDAGGSQTVVSRLNILTTTTTNGTGGVVAQPYFERDSNYSINGFFVGNDSAGGTISFTVSDQAGNTYNAIISSAASASLGDTFINALSFVDILNSGLATARVNAQATLTSGNQLRFLSSSSGKDVWVAINDTTTLATYKGLGRNFGITSGSSYGSGDGSFRIHIANNQPQYQVGSDQGQFMQIGFQDMGADALGVSDLDLTTTKGAQNAITTINTAIDRVSSERSKLGAFQNRLEHTVNNLRTTYSNLTASESRIRDTDMALEMVEFTRNQIISQSGTAMLAQANLIPQGVLQLLR